jgi:CspA family cold shock protein
LNIHTSPDPSSRTGDCQMAEVKTETGRVKETKYKDELLYCENCISFCGQPRSRRPHSICRRPKVCKACHLLMPATHRERGLVKWFNARKQFGFIVRRNADEIFAPAAEVKSRARLKEGDLVEFTIGANERGPIAKEIRILNSPNGSQ